jgi:hypothetical protein
MLVHITLTLRWNVLSLSPTYFFRFSNFGKLNYFLGARAAEEGRPSRYPTVDFCKDPEIICSSSEYKELKWIAGMFYNFGVQTL